MKSRLFPTLSKTAQFMITVFRQATQHTLLRLRCFLLWIATTRPWPITTTTYRRLLRPLRLPMMLLRLPMMLLLPTLLLPFLLFPLLEPLQMLLKVYNP